VAILYKNDHSWIAATGGREWAQIELPKPATVASVMTTRDRSGHYRDRIPEVFEVLVSLDGKEWKSVATRERTGPNRARRLPYFQVDRTAPHRLSLHARQRPCGGRAPGHRRGEAVRRFL
jgi:hypothetical protein